MDTERPHLPTAGPRAIPRQIIQARNSPRKSIAKGVPTESGQKHHARVKSSSSRMHPTHQQIPSKTTSIAGHSVNRQVERRSRQHGCPPISHSFTPLLHSYRRRLGKTPLQPLSRLESLPTEILEQIFFYTLSISSSGGFLSLPRASLPIARKLSSDYVRKELFIRMCNDPQSTKWQIQYKTVGKSDNEHARTQSWILRQQWLNIDFVRHCIQEYMVPILVHEMMDRKLHWHGTGSLVKAELEPRIREYIIKHVEPSHASSHSLHTHYTLHQWVEPDRPTKHVILGLNPPMGFISLRIYEAGISEHPDFYAQWRIMSLTSTTQIPSRLLHGPWTLPKIELLELIICGGATVDWIHTTAGEVAERGFLDALRENNARALRALCVCDNTKPGERKGATCTLVPSQGVGVIPEQEHLLMAIDQGCKEEVFETLINAPGSKCSLQAPEVIQGIHQMEKKGWLARAAWLAERRDDDWARRMQRTHDG